MIDRRGLLLYVKWLIDETLGNDKVGEFNAEWSHERFGLYISVHHVVKETDRSFGLAIQLSSEDISKTYRDGGWEALRDKLVVILKAMNNSAKLREKKELEPFYVEEMIDKAVRKREA
jgi:hypothetical protein